MDVTVLLVRFDAFLDIVAMAESQMVASLGLIFERDMVTDPCLTFNEKKIVYFRDPFDKESIFDHLIKKTVNGRRNQIDLDRAKRIHWIKYFLVNSLRQNAGFMVFSYKSVEKNIRTYIYHKHHKFLVVLEPTNNNEYVLITAHLRFDSGITEIKKRFKEKLPDIH